MPFRTFAGILFLAFLLLATPFAHAQRCVAQGDGRTWGPCGGSSSTRTITIIVEPPPRLAPLQIIWVRPDIKGSTQGSFSEVTNPGIRAQLDDMSVTGWQQLQKARRAEQQGNLELAKDYCDAARSRRNSAEENQEINLRCDLIGRALFDKRESTKTHLGIDRFEKTPNKEGRFALEIDFTPDQQRLMDNLFDPSRKEYKHLQEQVLSLYIQRAKAEANASQINLQLKHPEKYRDQKPVESKDLDAAMDEAKKADAEVKEKLKEIAPLIVIRK